MPHGNKQGEVAKTSEKLITGRGGTSLKILKAFVEHLDTFIGVHAVRFMYTF